MARKTQLLVEFPLQTGEIAYVNVRSDYVDYFGIVVADPAVLAEVELKERAAHTRVIYPAGLVGSGVNQTVPKTQHYGVKVRPPRIGVALKKILVPSELVTVKGSLRYATIHVPNRATNAQVAIWIKTKFLSHTPIFFLTPAGLRHPVNVTLPTVGSIERN